MNNIENALAAATIDQPRFNPAATRYRATFEHNGSAAMGYGSNEDEARHGLEMTLRFNLKYNGTLV